METPQERLNFFIIEVFKKKINFTNYLGVHSTWTTQYTGKGKSEIKDKAILDKLSAKGLNIEWYKSGKGSMLIEDKNADVEKNILSNAQETTKPIGFRVKFVTVPANAGKGYNFNDIPEAEIMVSREYPDSVLAFRIDGDSMLPTLRHNDIVYCDKSLEIRHGDVIICIVDGLLNCKRLILHDNEKFLKSDNPEFPEIKINGFNNSQIIGKVFKYEGTL